MYSLLLRLAPRRTLSPRRTFPQATQSARRRDRVERLLTSYVAQSGSDRNPDGYSETIIDGRTITIYTIQRVRFEMELTSMRETQLEERQNASRSRGRHRIFDLHGRYELESFLRDLGETYDRLHRLRSMFGPGSSSSTEDDEAWIFYIVSAVLPAGHPFLSAPSLSTDHPTYEDMLSLDSFLHKTVASSTDVAVAPGLYRVHARSGGKLYASREDAIIEIETDRCSICLDDFEESEEGRLLVKCEHFFHKDCIDPWLTEERNSCPLCRGEGVEKKTA